MSAPNGGEHLVVGTDTNVTWTLPAALTLGSFDVYADKTSPATHTKLNASPIAAEAGKTSYSLPWTVTEPLGADYKLRVVYNDGATEIASDASDAFLSIVAPTLRVTAPNGGESLIFGAQTQATWTVDNATLSVGSFDLEAVSPTKGSYTLNASPIAVEPEDEATASPGPWRSRQQATTSCTSSTATAPRSSAPRTTPT